MVGDPAAVAQQAARCFAGRRSARAQWHLLPAADRRAVCRHSGAPWALHDLREPLQSLAQGWRVGSTFGCGVKGLRWRHPDDRLLQHPRASARAAAEQRRGEAPALDAEDLVSYRRLAAREDPFGLATWRRKLANRDSDGAKR